LLSGVNNRWYMRPSRPGSDRRHLNGRECSLQSLTANVNGKCCYVNFCALPAAMQVRPEIVNPDKTSSIDGSRRKVIGALLQIPNSLWVRLDHSWRPNRPPPG
jgi:hypothetical protein